MEDIKIKWVVNESGEKYITSEEINECIEIDEVNKEIRNAKAFFREIIYVSFLNNRDRKIVLEEDIQNEVAEVKTIINELIQLCNSELNEKAKG